jgi:hypothetical protein
MANKRTKMIINATFRLCLVALMAFSSTTAFAQAVKREKVNNSIEWLSATSNIKVSNRLTIVLDGQFRFSNDFKPQQHQLRTALDIKINDHLSIAPVGYVYTWNYKYGQQPAAIVNNEHRIFQQVFYKHNLGPFKVDHRVRLEQRFIQVHSQSADAIVYDGYSNKQNRIRYRFMTRLPLNNKSIDPKTLFASAYDEIFYSWGKTITYDEPDQNRIFAGLGYQFDKMFSVQAGGIYQMLVKSNGIKQENNVGFLIAATYNINAMKSQ